MRKGKKLVSGIMYFVYINFNFLIELVVKCIKMLGFFHLVDWAFLIVFFILWWGSFELLG